MNKMLQVEMLYNSRKKNALIAYIVGFFLGAFGAHYFYCGKNDWGLAILMLLALGFITGGALMFLHVIAVMLGFVHTWFVVEEVNKDIYQGCMVMIESGDVQ